MLVSTTSHGENSLFGTLPTSEDCSREAGNLFSAPDAVFTHFTSIEFRLGVFTRPAVFFRWTLSVVKSSGFSVLQQAGGCRAEVAYAIEDA
jgi:hypothetical protein